MKTFPIFNGAKSDGKPWFTVKNLAEEPNAEILIYEQIGKDWWSGEGIGAKDFIDEVKQIPKGRQIKLRINSGGGNVHDGLAIYNYLQSRKDDVTCIVDGVAASIASIIALAGKTLEMPRNALLMIHEPWTYAQGNADDMRKAADALDTHRDSLVTVYEAKTGKTANEIGAAMKAETWFTGDEARAFGLCDTVTGELAAQASIPDLSTFRRVPESLKASTPKQPAAPSGTPTPQDTMNKAQIIALLKSKGIAVPENATEEQLMNLLTGAVNNATPTPTPTPAPAPANVIDANAALAEELKQIRAERDAQKKAAIKAALVVCGNEGRIPLNSVDGWAESCMKDESLLAKVQAMEPKLPGAEPVAMHVDVTNEDPKIIFAAFDGFNKPMNALIAGSKVDPKNISAAACSKGVFYAKHRDRMLQVLNTNTMPAGLQRQAILQEIIRDFARRILPLRAFSTVFQNVPLLGTNKVDVPFYDLDSGASTSWDPSTGYAAGNTTTTAREITVGYGASNGDRLYQGMAFTSEEIARQPFLNTVQLARLKAEKLAYDVFADVLGVVTAANFGDAAVVTPASAFDRDDVVDLKLACKLWPEMGRSLILDSDYDAGLLKDSKITDADKSGDQEAIRNGIIRRLMGFDMYEIPTIPDNSEYLKGFAVFQSAILVATAPVPPVQEVRNAGTTYEIVVDPQTGIAFEYRTFGSNVLDRAEHYIECNYGFAKGNANALKRITSQ